MQSILITGCSTGFGEAIARRFAAEGWNVLATMRDPAAAPDFPENVTVLRLDVQDQDSIAAAVRFGIDTFGGLDALVNNAGFGLVGPFEAAPRDKIQEQFDVNVFGLMDVTRAVLPHFRARRGGTIVNITSGAGVFGLPMNAFYAATKFAVEGFTESLEHELAPFGIRMKLVEPGGVLSTSFGTRVGTDMQSFAAIEDYKPVEEAAWKLFGRISQERSDGTVEQVAEATFQSVTDGTDRLRYVATEGIKPWVRARRETSEEEYMKLMRREVGLGLKL